MNALLEAVAAGINEEAVDHLRAVVVYPSVHIAGILVRLDTQMLVLMVIDGIVYPAKIDRVDWRQLLAVEDHLTRLIGEARPLKHVALADPDAVGKLAKLCLVLLTAGRTSPHGV